MIEQVNTIDRDAACRRRQVAGDHLHGGRFSGPVGTKKSQHFTTLEFKVDILDGGIVPVKATEVFDLDKDVIHGMVIIPIE